MMVSPFVTGALPIAIHGALGIAPNTLFVMAMLGVEVLVASVLFVRNLRKDLGTQSTMASSDAWFGTATMFLALAFSGAALLTPSESLPGPQPAPGTWWLVLPALPTYRVVAVLAHALVALVGQLIVVVLSWPTSDSPPKLQDRLRAAPWVVVPTAVVVVALELGGWPSWFVIGWEFTVSYLAAGTISAVAWHLWMTRPLGSVGFRRLYGQGTVLLRGLAAITLGALVLALHPYPPPVIGAFALFLLLTLLDEVVAPALAALSARPGDHRLLITQRWLLTVPLAAGLTLLGAAGMLGVVSPTRGYTSDIWLVAGGAAIAYLFLRPVVFMAPQAKQTTVNSEVGPRVVRIGRALGRIRLPLLMIVAGGLAAYMIVSGRAEGHMGFVTGVAPVAAGLVAIACTLMTVVRGGPRRRPFLLLLAALLVGVGANLLSMLHLWLPAQALMTVANVAGECLALLSIGTVAYALGRVAVPRVPVGDAADARDHLWLASIHMQRAPNYESIRYQQETLRALAAARRATELHAGNAGAWSQYANALHCLGAALQDADDLERASEYYEQSLSARKEVEALTPHDTWSLCNHAETLRRMAQLKQRGAEELGKRIKERYDLIARRRETMTPLEGGDARRAEATIAHLRADAAKQVQTLSSTLEDIAAIYREAGDLCERALTMLNQEPPALPPEAGLTERLNASVYGERERCHNRQYALVTMGRLLFDEADAHRGQRSDGHSAAEIAALEERTLTTIQAALELGAEPQALNIKGILLQRQGKAREAASAFQAAFEASQKRDAVIAVNLGSAWEKAGEWAQALGAYEQALALKPAYADARAGRDRMRSRIASEVSVPDATHDAQTQDEQHSDSTETGGNEKGV